MRKRYGAIIFMAIVLIYALMQVATSKDYCEDPDCQQMRAILVDLSKDHGYEHILNVNRCPYLSDTLCVMSEYKRNYNWEMLADTICAVATRHGISQPVIFILKEGNYPYDTLAKKRCP
jgi:hypothetical protein